MDDLLNEMSNSLMGFMLNSLAFFQQVFDFLFVTHKMVSQLAAFLLPEVASVFPFLDCNSKVMDSGLKFMASLLTVFIFLLPFMDFASEMMELRFVVFAFLFPFVAFSFKVVNFSFAVFMGLSEVVDFLLEVFVLLSPFMDSASAVLVFLMDVLVFLSPLVDSSLTVFMFLMEVFPLSMDVLIFLSPLVNSTLAMSVFLLEVVVFLSPLSAMGMLLLKMMVLLLKMMVFVLPLVTVFVLLFEVMIFLLQFPDEMFSLFVVGHIFSCLFLEFSDLLFELHALASPAVNVALEFYNLSLVFNYYVIVLTHFHFVSFNLLVALLQFHFVDPLDLGNFVVSEASGIVAHTEMFRYFAMMAAAHFNFVSLLNL